MDEDFINVYDVNQNFRIVRQLQVKRYGVHDLAISKNFLGACSNDGKLRFFEHTSNLSKVKFLKNESATKSMAISPN